MKRGRFSLSSRKNLSMDMGGLYPIGCVEVLPGDIFQHNTTAMIRLSPMLAPVMHPTHATIRHFFVPTRLLWKNFQDFITGGPDGNNASVAPYMVWNPAVAVKSLGDHLGLPTGVTGLQASALPFRAYALIWNEYYRDQDLQTPLVISLDDGADTTTNRTLQNVSWEKDYFTSARPWPQKGTEVTIPVLGSAPVEGIGVTSNAGLSATTQSVWETGKSTPSNMSAFATNAANVVGQIKVQSNAIISATNLPQIYANLAAATGLPVTLFRQGLAYQRFKEKMARYGSRYTEYLRALGVKSSDARLQRPEYLGGGTEVIQYSEVLSTADSANAPIGTLKGHGLGGVRSNRYKRYFEEHGYVISLLSVKPRTMYVQGLPRMWSRTAKEHYWQPEFEHIGQQQILNQEVYAAHTTPLGVFGYQDRYDEYRREESRVAGEFRTTALDYWHLARIFASDPALNASFVSSVPSKRIFASQATDTLYVMVSHQLNARRKVSQRADSFIF